jgi:hypothetical protein
MVIDIYFRFLQAIEEEIAKAKETLEKLQQREPAVSQNVVEAQVCSLFFCNCIQNLLKFCFEIFLPFLLFVIIYKLVLSIIFFMSFVNFYNFKI